MKNCLLKNLQVLLFNNRLCTCWEPQKVKEKFNHKSILYVLSNWKTRKEIFSAVILPKANNSILFCCNITKGKQFHAIKMFFENVKLFEGWIFSLQNYLFTSDLGPNGPWKLVAQALPFADISQIDFFFTNPMSVTFGTFNPEEFMCIL